MRQVERVVPVVRIHTAFRGDAELLEPMLLRDEIEHIVMSSPEDAVALISRYRGRIMRATDLSAGERALAWDALDRLARARPMAPPLDSILPPGWLEALRRGQGFDLIPLLRKAVEYIEDLKLHPTIQRRSIEGTRALADSLVMA
jgi:hypothetical protein